MHNEIIELIINDTGTEPITLAEAKEWLRVLHDDDDTLIVLLITTARKRVERYSGRSIVAKDITLSVRLCSDIYLPYAPIGDVVTVEVLKGSDRQVLTIGDYRIIGGREKVFSPLFGGVYGIKYRTDADNDSGLLLDVRRVLLWLYENRGDGSADMPLELMSNAKQLKNYSWV